MTATAAGTLSTLTATVNSVALASTPSFTVSAGPISATNYTVSLASATVASGQHRHGDHRCQGCRRQPHQRPGQLRVQFRSFERHQRGHLRQRRHGRWHRGNLHRDHDRHDRRHGEHAHRHGQQRRPGQHADLHRRCRADQPRPTPPFLSRRRRYRQAAPTRSPSSPRMPTATSSAAWPTPRSASVFFERHQRGHLRAPSRPVAPRELIPRP